MTKDYVLKEFTSIKGIGKSKAELLYENGYTSLDKLKLASVNDLTKIKGITNKLAEEIYNHFREKEKIPTKKIKKVEKKNDKTEEPKKTEELPEEIKEDEKVEIVDTGEGEYRVKKKPELSKELKDKLLVRKQIKMRTPNFFREEWFRYKRIPKNWRRPNGISSKMRINLKYRPSKVRVGFKGPKETRGLHSSGFEEIMVYNVSDIEKIDPRTQAARVGGNVGTKKRLEIVKKADELNIRIINRGR